MKKPKLIAISFAFFVALLGFNLNRTLVPKDEILSGGPPKDGIPAILKPHFIEPDEADFLKPEDPVIGIQIAGRARAYGTGDENSCSS